MTCTLEAPLDCRAWEAAMRATLLEYEEAQIEKTPRFRVLQGAVNKYPDLAQFALYRGMISYLNLSEDMQKLA